MFLVFIFSALPAFAQPATNNPFALVPAYAELPPIFWEQHGTLLMISGGALIILAALVVWKMLQPKPAVVLPPEVLARAALAKLLRQKEDGKLLSDVSQILRRYVMTAFELPAAELTTAEFCAAIGANEKIGTEAAQAISSFFHECDAQKFSSSLTAAPLNAALRALEIVAQVEKETHGQDARATTR